MFSVYLCYRYVYVVCIDECATSNGDCDSLTACTNTNGSRICGDCPEGYSGSGYSSCEDVDECLSNNGGCSSLVTCTNVVGSRVCGTCPSGYSGDGVGEEFGCTDIGMSHISVKP